MMNTEKINLSESIYYRLKNIAQTKKKPIQKKMWDLQLGRGK